MMLWVEPARCGFPAKEGGRSEPQRRISPEARACAGGRGRRIPLSDAGAERPERHPDHVRSRPPLRHGGGHWPRARGASALRYVMAEGTGLAPARLSRAELEGETLAAALAPARRQ